MPEDEATGELETEARADAWVDLEEAAAEVQAEARQVRTAALPCDQAGLAKLVVVTLKAALDERGLETTGQKAVLVERLLEALKKEL